MSSEMLVVMRHQKTHSGVAKLNSINYLFLKDCIKGEK